VSKEIIDLAGKTDNKDFLLSQTLDYLKSLNPEERSAVVAAVYDRNSGKLYAATSVKFNSQGKGFWHHAEYEALANARENVADLTASVFVSSLSACVKDSSTRAHISCTNTLTDAGFPEEFVGRLDKGAATLNQYQKMGLTVNITENPDLLLVCDRLYDFFNRFKKNGRTKEQIISDALSLLPKP
jgi:pyrimidine deaminase RibD-like protein